MPKAAVQDRLLEDAQVRRDDGAEFTLPKRDGARTQRRSPEAGVIHGPDEGRHGGDSLEQRRDGPLRIAYEVHFPTFYQEFLPLLA